jgi:mono/diheme cytochrome c family protein
MAGLLILNAAWALAKTESTTPIKVRGWDSTALENIPDNARARRNPLQGDPDAWAAGKKLFGDHCSECHGKDARGGKRGPSLHAMAAHNATSGEIFFVLTNGVIRHGMPGWSKLPEPERWQLVIFLESLRDDKER